MIVLRIGSRDDDVRKWQYFLIGQGYDPSIADGIFGEKTKADTIIFQLEHSLQPDGIVGNKTTGMAMTLGFGVYHEQSRDRQQNKTSYITPKFLQDEGFRKDGDWREKMEKEDYGLHQSNNR